ncbi:27808_t:CDS:2 [Dentiscutata erythropus]|uniref:27808_t:CDS:1 n=1 Tax=Dentiscutata erythropus TaxID=1348616 RepID=A0A9N9CTF2_9GLOM|nr:27808_t:CDS:2 [Dentiscutata erythropus]
MALDYFNRLDYNYLGLESVSRYPIYAAFDIFNWACDRWSHTRVDIAGGLVGLSTVAIIRIQDYLVLEEDPPKIVGRMAHKEEIHVKLHKKRNSC